MAGTRAAVNSGAVATGSTQTKTILSLTASANVAIVADLISISFNGTSPTAGKILVEVLRSATSGSGGTNNPPVKMNASDSESIQATAKSAYTLGSPMTGTTIANEYVHPQQGYTMPIGSGGLKIKAGETVAINVTAPADVSCVARIQFWE